MGVVYSVLMFISGGLVGLMYAGSFNSRSFWYYTTAFVFTFFIAKFIES